MELIKGQTVIVLGLDMYKPEARIDECPFRATVQAAYERDIVVKSEETGKEYEVYDADILECFDKDAIRKMVSVEAWENDGGLTFFTEYRDIREE